MPKKNLVPCGYCMLDDLIAAWEERKPDENKERKQILIAPSWNEDNILDSCVDELIERLMAPDRKIIVRPHPEYVKRFQPKMEALMKRWAGKTGDGLEFETDFSSNRTIWESDLLITDWSGIAYEYSYTTGNPTLFINTKMKMLNQNWEKLGIEPVDFILRRQLGETLEKEELGRVNETVTEMLENRQGWHDRIMQIREENIYNIGHCGGEAAKYIIGRLTHKQAEA